MAQTLQIINVFMKYFKYNQSSQEMWINRMIVGHKYYCCQSKTSVSFYKFSGLHNFKGAAIYHPNGNKSYCLDAIDYGDSFYGINNNSNILFSSNAKL